MCGIAGVLSTTDRHLPDLDVLGEMSRRIAHRGPDGAGLLALPPGGPLRGTLLHRRLSVLDPDPRASQPFTVALGCRRVHLVFNGEIYNYRELRRELQPLLPGFAWRTTGDTEVLAAAYLAWGASCLHRLIGMFAFAVADQTAGRLLLARDRMGQKPLYYATSDDGEALAFASELPALTAVPWVPREIDDQALSHYLAFGYTPLAGSIRRGISKLLPGCAMTFPGRSPAPYWSPPSPPRDPPRPHPDPVAAVRDLTRAAVASQLVSDVPLGCFLSGGIDSSVVALCAQQHLASAGGRLRTFTVAFDDPRYDEAPFAAEVARHLGTDHTELRVRPGDAAELVADLQRLARAFGEPFADSSCLPTYYLCREARRHVTVALAGDGGDELFCGYDRYRALDLAQRVGRWGVGGGLVRGLGGWLARGHPKSHLTRLGRFLAAAGLPPGEQYESYVRLFGPPLLPLTGSVAGRPWPADLPPVLAAMTLDRSTYLDGDLLTKVDRTSMQVALEVRAPFLDHRLVELAAGMTAGELFPGGLREKKPLLRRAFEAELPAQVFRRPKRGFAVPIGDWFRTSLHTWLSGLLRDPGSLSRSRLGPALVETLIDQHLSGVHDHTHRLFALVMLDLWHRGTDPPPA